MQQSSKQTDKLWLSIPDTPLEMLPSLAYIRFSLITAVENMLQRGGYFCTSDTTQNQEQLPNIGEFFNSIQTSQKAYKASLSRQLATDLPPDFEQTSLKDEPKDWFIKTADFGDDCDRILQHRDGEFTQLLEDITRYHQIFQQGYDKIILIRPPTYTGYDIQLTAAMQCLGYTKEQFQFIIVQPIKLYAFHKPTQQIHPLPDIATDELIQAIGMDALRWHCLRAPLTSVAPINISTAGQPIAADSLYRVQSTHARCCVLLRQAHEQGVIQLDASHSDSWAMLPLPLPLSEYSWDSSNAENLVGQLQLVPKVLAQSAAELAPHLVIHHLEALSPTCHQWLNTINLTQPNCVLLLAIKQAIFDLLENILTIEAPEWLE